MLRYRLEHAQDLRTHWKNPRDVGTDLSIPVSSAEDGNQEHLSVRKLRKVLETMRLRISVSRKCSDYGYGDE